MVRVSVIVPNWNGAEHLPACLDSLLAQQSKAHIIVVDNGSADDSRRLLSEKYPAVEVIALSRNRGFAGGVNAGLRRAMELGCKYAALLNNDAVAEPGWLKSLVAALDKNAKTGIAASKMLSINGQYIDSTGENYSIWGLPYPRGRGQADHGQFDSQRQVFGASGGASLYRLKMLEQIGLFDEAFFAYYEDVDLSFRAQLAGWQVIFEPSAIVRHQIGATSSRLSGFATYHTLKNLPLLLWKNVPWALMPKIWPRLVLSHGSFTIKAVAKGQVWPVAKAFVMGTLLWFRALAQRRRIQSRRKVNAAYIAGLMSYDLPPEADGLRRLREILWKITGRQPR
jgi:GT2 family glycosyltransferase